MARTPVRASAADETTPKKTRVRKGGSMKSPLDIPLDILERLGRQGVDLQWVTDSVLGQPSPQTRMAFEVNGWEPVTPEMFDGVFDGMFTRRGHKGEINFDGLVLMWRPMELTIEAREEEQSARNAAMAAQLNMIKSGSAINGLASGFEADHATVRNRVSRSVHAPMDIPRD